MTSRYSRRKFLAYSGGAMAGSSALGSAFPGFALGQTPAVPSTLSEAPMLAEMVNTGSLPPVAERLPKQPMVITPIESIGQYGGTWRTGMLGASDTAYLLRTLGYENLVRWDVGYEEMYPNLAERWEANEAGTEYTFYLREGLRWSDGEPATADDVLFWYEHMILNEEVVSTSETGVVPSWFRQGEQIGEIVKVDDYTFKMVFPEPNGVLMLHMAGGGGSPWWPQAKYAEQFHIAFNEEAVQRMVTEENFPDWGTLFNQKINPWLTSNVPTLFPWVMTTALNDTTTRLVATRNPYYWKVDTEGNQLPYLDEVVYDIVENVEVLTFKALGGEIEFIDRHVNTLENTALFVSEQESCGCHLTRLIPDAMNNFTILFNYNHQDPVMRDLIHNENFRIGLSHATNRQEIIDLVYFGQGEPWQAGPLEESPYYHERLATQYLEYDVERANQLLDEAGLTERGENGMRLRPDGEPLQLVFDVANIVQLWVDTASVLKDQWAEVGIDVVVNSIERGLRAERVENLEFDVTNWWGDGGLDAVTQPFWYLAYASFNSFAPAWALWWETNGERGEEPIEPAKRQQEIYEQVVTTPDLEEQAALMQELLDISAEQFWVPAVAKPGETYAVVKDNFKNVADTMFASGGAYPQPGPSMPEQFYLEQ